MSTCWCAYHRRFVNSTRTNVCSFTHEDNGNDGNACGCLWRVFVYVCACLCVCGRFGATQDAGVTTLPGAPTAPVTPTQVHETPLQPPQVAAPRTKRKSIYLQDLRDHAISTRALGPMCVPVIPRVVSVSACRNSWFAHYHDVLFAIPCVL